MSHTPPHPQGPQLPTEICEEIISYVNRQETLWACALVCRSWVPRSRVQLYRAADVRGGRIHKFLDMIVMHPHLGVNLEQLYLGGYEDSTDIYRFFGDVISLLPNITSLRYISLPIPYLHLPLFSSGLLSLTSLTLSEIKADSFGDFVRFVSFHKHLKELTILGCSWKRSSVHHYSFGMRWGRDLQKLSFYDCEYQRCLHIQSVKYSKEPVVPFIANDLAMRWATTMKAIYLDFDRDIAKAGDAKEAVFSSLTAYIRFCPNLHTVTLDISEYAPWVLQQLPDILSGLASLCRILFRVSVREAGAEDLLLGDNEKAWTTLDENLGDDAKFRNLEYVEVLCGGSGRKGVPSWWENDTGSSEDGESDSGRESEDEGWETESREECNSRTIDSESLKGEEAKQKQEIPWGAELTSYGLTNLHRMMDGVADFHRRKKPLTDIFPRLSKRGVLWCDVSRICYHVLHITASNFVGMKSRNWRPRYRESLYYD
ncbi:hypothetical protein NLI96_g8598 [Meripilus lineatus]|uniref:F-box domain-containing protein n=1 Tax=Meripilus lineatus TaxID=2056292 RepID=A0AAD5YG52_9APHY|nr:hypothetical protein NLI96_g8598 [Physisporinus lineatus]